jgi:hypothetical protein
MALNINADGSFSDAPDLVDAPLPMAAPARNTESSAGSTGTEHLHPKQFKSAASGVKTRTGSIGQSGKLPVYGNVPASMHHSRHGKSYSAEADIASSMTKRKKTYQGKHTPQGIASRNAPPEPEDKKKAPPKLNKFQFRPSKHEGKNAERLRAMAGGKI